MNQMNGSAGKLDFIVEFIVIINHRLNTIQNYKIQCFFALWSIRKILGTDALQNATIPPAFTIRFVE